MGMEFTKSGFIPAIKKKEEVGLMETAGVIEN